MKKTFIFILIAGILMALIAIFYPKSKSAAYNIGIVLPIAHVALDDIVSGFQSELLKEMGGEKVNIEVQNALGDINLQKSAINKFINQHVDLLVPVTTSTTQMAINLAPKDINILFLAADISKDSAIAEQNPKLMGVNDEISIELQAQFIHKAMPELKKIALVYSASDKFFTGAEIFIKAALKEGISVQKLMVQNVSELYTVSKRIENDVGAIFMLKDSIVASGIATLVQQADERRIPLITSDEGTNKSGGAFALGVIEKDIGRQGGVMAAPFLKDKKIAGARIENVSRILVFVNNEACARQGLDPAQVLRAASEMKLEVFKE